MIIYLNLSMSDNIALQAHDKDSYKEQQVRRSAAEAVEHAADWGVLKPSFKDSPGEAVKTFPQELRQKLKDSKPRHWR